jgi:Ser/Thr protein kinase RdoA (MazF antagonist)
MSLKKETLGSGEATQPAARGAQTARKLVVLPDEAVAMLRRAYDTGDWLSWERIQGGRSNHTFFVTASSGNYVLRRSNTRKSVGKNAEAVRFEVRLIDYLRERGYPAPQIIPTRGGERYVEHDGLFYLMTAFIAGSSYDPENPEHLLAAGDGLGRYHRLVSTLSGPYYAHRSSLLTNLGPEGVGVLDQVKRLAEPFLDIEERKRLQDSVSYLQNQFVGVSRAIVELYPGLSKLVIHGSFGRSTLLFAGDTLIGVVDYDRARFEVRVMDLAVTIKGFCRDYKSGEDYWIGLDYARCRDLLAAYLEVEPLPKEELRALPLIFRGQHLAKVQERCGNLVNKNALVPQEAKDVLKLVTKVEQETARLHWLETHSADLLAAFEDG